jgi:acylpyruvate hydrolase
VRVATLRIDGGTRAVRVDNDRAIEIDGSSDIGALLAAPDWRDRAEAATGAEHDLGEVDYAPLIPRPDKIICVGLNYRSHILEVGRPLPEHPTLFPKYRAALIGAHDAVCMPPESDQVDWEAELAVVIGRPARRVSGAEAMAVIAGYSVLNDVTVRDWQNHTIQWLPGKTFEATTPIGPWLVTPDDPAISGRTGFDISCEVDGEQVQGANTGDLVFDACALISYISTIITLLPGDVIATGTPGGVGHARQPPRYLQPGSRLVTRIEGVGECVNACAADNTT